jgi:hypothetical protein
MPLDKCFYEREHGTKIAATVRLLRLSGIGTSRAKLVLQASPIIDEQSRNSLDLQASHTGP